MDKVEIAKLLTQISAIDNRQIDEARVEMWHTVLGGHDYEDAIEALPLFFQKSDEYLSPRRLIVEIKAVREERARVAQMEQRELEESEGSSDPMPVCAEHELPILDCVPCCKTLAALAEMHPSDRHAYAVTHVYKAA